MSKVYKVWIEIEEHDEETDEYQTLDAPGAAVAEFDTYEKAWAYAERLTEAGGGVVDPAERPEPEEICSTPGCGASLDDGEGWDGKCGNCADKEAKKKGKKK